MRTQRRGARLAGAAALPLVAALALAGCSGDDAAEPDRSPDDALADAKEALDGVESLDLAIDSSDVPGNLSPVLLTADGTATRPDSFEGEITVRLGTGSTTIGVVSEGGVVTVPLLGEVNPADYNAPDPGTLLDPEAGVSSLLTALQGAEAGSTERDEDDPSVRVTTYTGTLDAAAVRAVIPSADDGDFETEFRIDDDDLLRSATMTGAFYPDSDPMTYVITLSDFGDQ